MGGLFFAGLICGRLWRGLLQGLMSAPARRGGDFAGRKACTARRRVMLSVKKSRQKNFGAEFVSAFGGAEILQGAKPVRLPGEGLLFYEEK